VRENTLDIVGKAMREDSSVKLKYASKFASIANYWKKWIGEKTGLEKSNAVDKKLELEQAFEEKVKESPELWGQYGHLMKKFNEYYSEIEKYSYTRDYYSEVVGRNVEVLGTASIMDRLISRYENGGADEYNAYKNRVIPYLEGVFKNYRKFGSIYH
jgi:hypothetical protein